MEKFVLLNHGGYFGGLEKLEYPIEVLGAQDGLSELVMVLGSELIKIGGLPEGEDGDEGFDPEWKYAFFLGEEADLLDNLTTL